MSFRKLRVWAAPGFAIGAFIRRPLLLRSPTSTHYFPYAARFIVADASFAQDCTHFLQSGRIYSDLPHGFFADPDHVMPARATTIATQCVCTAR